MIANGFDMFEAYKSNKISSFLCKKNESVILLKIKNGLQLKRQTGVGTTPLVTGFIKYPPKIY